jgi:hypothetical protein
VNRLRSNLALNSGIRTDGHMGIIIAFNERRQIQIGRRLSLGWEWGHFGHDIEEGLCTFCKAECTAPWPGKLSITIPKLAKASENLCIYFLVS